MGERHAPGLLHSYPRSRPRESWDMELRSRRRLPPPAQPRRRRLSPDRNRIIGPDRISALPEDLLLKILAGLRSARAAARTSGLSSQWPGLWSHLPDLSFRDVSANGVESALAQVESALAQGARPALSLLEVEIPHKKWSMDPAGASTLLRAAARLAPADLVFCLWGCCKDSKIPIEIPCFERATSVNLRVWNLLLTPPAGGAEFPLLERLSLYGCRVVDTAALVLRCPRLRVFEIDHEYLGTVKVHSPTIEELVVHGKNLRNMDIMAPMLKRFSLQANVADGYTLSFSAPMVENLWWYWWRYEADVGFGERWRMGSPKLEIKENVGVLRLNISFYIPDGEPPAANRSFSQEIAPLPAFSVLDLHLRRGHVYGAVLSHLLGICSTIRSLQLSLSHPWQGKETCSPNCPCDQPQNWRNEIISLTALEEVKVTGFGGADHDLDFLKLLFRCAPLMKSMTVGVAPELLPTDEDCKEIYTIFKANPGVKWSIYRSSRED